VFPVRGGGEDFAHPAGSADRGDFGFDGRAVAAGLAARQLRLQLGQAATGLGQGLVEPAGLLVVQGRRVCQHRAPGHSQGGHFRVDIPHAGIPVVVNRALAGFGTRSAQTWDNCNLVLDEVNGGHAIERHVGKSDSFLVGRKNSRGVNIS
jgi:hypothetical protein